MRSPMVTKIEQINRNWDRKQLALRTGEFVLALSFVFLAYLSAFIN